jgi:hypothetical protein
MRTALLAAFVRGACKHSRERSYILQQLQSPHDDIVCEVKSMEGQLVFRGMKPGTTIRGMKQLIEEQVPLRCPSSTTHNCV